METTISINKRLTVITKGVAIMLLLVAVQAQYSEDFEVPNLPLATEFHSEILLPASEASAPSPSYASSEPDGESLLEESLSRRYPKANSHPKRRVMSPEKTCQNKCAKKCLVKKGYILGNLCSGVCQPKCLLDYYRFIYTCTYHCAKLMPEHSKSDGKKAVISYVKKCRKQCIRKFF